jgi:hypothetical protein
LDYLLRREAIMKKFIFGFIIGAVSVGAVSAFAAWKITAAKYNDVNETNIIIPLESEFINNDTSCKIYKDNEVTVVYMSSLKYKRFLLSANNETVNILDFVGYPYSDYSIENINAIERYGSKISFIASVVGHGEKRFWFDVEKKYLLEDSEILFESLIYKIRPDNKLEAVRYCGGAEADVVIPETIQGRTVAYFGDYLLQSGKLNSLLIPPTVIEFGYGALATLRVKTLKCKKNSYAYYMLCNPPSVYIKEVELFEN